MCFFVCASLLCSAHVSFWQSRVSEKVEPLLSLWSQSLRRVEVSSSPSDALAPGASQRSADSTPQPAPSAPETFSVTTQGPQGLGAVPALPWEVFATTTAVPWQ
jgi:hypothetical protein